MDDQILWALLAKYIAGECSPQERHEIEDWIRAQPSREELVEQLHHIWEAAGDPPAGETEDALDLESEWNELRARMDVDEPSSSSEETSGSEASRPASPRSRGSARRPATTKGWLIAGTIAVLGVMIGGLLFGGPYLWNKDAGEGSGAEYRVVETNQGERAALQLSDGTSVQVHANSKLRLPKAFDNRERVVHLTGEAYFDVAPDSTWPFFVETSNATVNVRGTSFDVRAYPGSEVQVAVEEGSVTVHPEQASEEHAGAKLKSGMVGRVGRSDSTVVTEESSILPFVGWTKGRLVFRNATLPEVAARLERWYGLEVKIQDPSLRDLQLTANLRSQALRDVLDIVAASLRIEYRIEEETVFLTP
jgi:transmembrane sensor